MLKKHSFVDLHTEKEDSKNLVFHMGLVQQHDSFSSKCFCRQDMQIRDNMTSISALAALCVPSN